MKMLIGGKSSDSSDKKTIEVLNPATDEVLDTVPLATREDVETVLDNARKGFEEWSAYPLYKRINIIKAFVQKVKDDRDKLRRILQSETGKTVSAAAGCIDGSIALAEHYIGLSGTFGGETFPGGNQPDTEGTVMLTVHEPLGVVLCILPFNFPIDAYMHKVIPALLMGNAVVIKPASNTPLTDILITELLLSTGIPGKAVQLITGSGSKVGNWLTGDKRVDLVNLTGSTQVGVKIAANSAAYLHRLHLELGGNDGLIILEDADVAQAVQEAFGARVGNTGQVCCAAKRFIVHHKIKDEFCKALVGKLKSVKIGNPVDPAVECGPLISKEAAEELENQIRHCTDQGARILCGGKKMNGAFFEMTAMEITPECDAAQDLELFGPVWSILSFETIEEAIRLANNTMYGLSAGVIGKDIKTMMKVAHTVKAGACVINGSGAYRSSDQPFGGYKMSGLGREGGRYTLEELSQVKTIILKGVL
jgi:succinate-semialdehyde dehydrogenase/glutarate-semialdehyde dehydrogenase